jgi:hypothetical protein
MRCESLSQPSAQRSSRNALTTQPLHPSNYPRYLLSNLSKKLSRTPLDSIPTVFDDIFRNILY